MKVKSIALAAFIILGLTGCQKNEVDQPSINSRNDLMQSFVRADADLSIESSALKGAKVNDMISSINEAIAEHNILLEKVETYGAEQEGITLFFKNVGNKQLSSHWVPNDPESGNGLEIPFIIDATELGTSSGMTEGETFGAILNVMNTWDNITCSGALDIPFTGAVGIDVGYVQNLYGFGGFPGFFPGITYGGILPSGFFDAIYPNGGKNILGVTFTFIWTEGGTPTDMDNNRKNDVAFREIYLNDNFNWQDAPDDVIGNDIYDFETVVLHETGHGLSQGHFGKAFVASDGYIHFAPYALMNSGYSIGNREINETDLAGHCSIWSSWPRE